MAALSVMSRNFAPQQSQGTTADQGLSSEVFFSSGQHAEEVVAADLVVKADRDGPPPLLPAGLPRIGVWSR